MLQPAFGRLPLSLEDLIFGDGFNQPVRDLPPGLTSLRFGNSFNQSVMDLPTGLKSLRFRKSFDQPVPVGLKHLLRKA